MDTLTHALSGALLARATAPREARVSLRARVVTGFFAAAAPDLDFVLSYVSPAAYLTGHRGLTHSVLLLPLWAWLIAWTAARLTRRGATWRDYYGIAALSIGIHILGDLITSFGTMILAPLSDARFAWDTTFIIDPWFSGIIVAGLVASALWRRSRVPAVAGLAVLAGYVGFQAMQRDRALEVARAHAAAAGWKEVEIAALPRPVSPFNWMAVVIAGDRYHYAFVNLRRDRPPAPAGPDAGFIARLDAAYQPLVTAKWLTQERYGETPADRSLAADVLARPELAFFRWFAAMPVMYRIDHGNPSTCVWFEDLRFLTPGRDTNPFRFGICDEKGAPGGEALRLLDDGRRVPAS